MRLTVYRVTDLCLLLLKGNELFRAQNERDYWQHAVNVAKDRPDLIAKYNEWSESLAKHKDSYRDYNSNLHKNTVFENTYGLKVTHVTS